MQQAEPVGGAVRLEIRKSLVSVLCLPVVWGGLLGSAHALDLPPEIAAAVANQSGIEAGTALLNTCVTGRNDGNQFQADCNAIFGESDPLVAANAINQVVADQVSAQNTAAARQFGIHVGVVGDRLAQIRLGDSRFPGNDDATLAEYRLLGQSVGGGASSEADFGRLGAFFNARYRWGDQDSTVFTPGLDFDGWGFTAGMDYRLSDRAVAGVALNLVRDEVDYDGGRGDMTTDAWGLSLYGTRYWDNGFFVDGLVGHSWTDHDLERRLAYASGSQTVSQVASSGTDGKMLMASVGGGYSMDRGGFSITPAVRLDYVRNKVDGFEETMSSPGSDGGGMAVGVESTTYKSLTSRVGVQMSRAFSHAGGVVLPSARLDWVHEFENDQQLINGRFLGDVANDTPFFVFTDNPDRDYLDLELSLSGQFAGGRSAFVAYNALLGFSDVTYHAVTAGLRMEF